MPIMAKTLVLWFLGVSTLVAAKNILPISDFDTMPMPGNIENNFWNKLETKEKEWIMNSSVVLHLRNLNYIHPLPTEEEFNMPLTLAPKFLNGEVPEQFQANMVKWMKQYLGVDDQDLYALVQGKEVCGPVTCSDYPGMGGNCCPWG